MGVFLYDLPIVTIGNRTAYMNCFDMEVPIDVIARAIGYDQKNPGAGGKYVEGWSAFQYKKKCAGL